MLSNHIPKTSAQNPKNFLPGSIKIPKKLLSKPVSLNSTHAAQSLRIKRWKISSCQVGRSFDLSLQMPSRSGDPETRRKNFYKAYRQLTLQGMLKSVKRLQFDIASVGERKLSRVISRSRRLEKFTLNNLSVTYPIGKLIKRLPNSRLKNLSIYIASNHPSSVQQRFQSLARLVHRCRYLINSNLWLDYNLGGGITTFLLKTKKLQSLKRCLLRNRKENIDNTVIPNAFESLEGIHLRTSDSLFKFIEIVSKCPSTHPNLKYFKFENFGSSSGNHNNKIVDISFLKNHPQLALFSATLGYSDTSSLDVLTDLPNLRDFTFISTQTPQKASHRLPQLSTLEKVNIKSGGSSEFSSENVHAFLLSNKNLKQLKLELPLEQICLIFRENFILSVQEFTLSISQVQNPLPLETKALFRQECFKDIKALHLTLPYSISDLNAMLFQGIASLNSLKTLSIRSMAIGEVKQDKLKHLKDIFIQVSGLQSLSLAFAHDLINSKEFSQILEGFIHLKNLKYFNLELSLAEVSSETFESFLKFLYSIQNMAEIILCLQGISQEQQNTLNSLLKQKFPYGITRKQSL